MFATFGLVIGRVAHPERVWVRLYTVLSVVPLADATEHPAQHLISPTSVCRATRSSNPSRASSILIVSSISIFAGRAPANQRALDHSQSSGLSTKPRRTGLAWM